MINKMTKEQKDLLVEDICSRLLYNVKCRITLNSDGKTIENDDVITGILPKHYEVLVQDFDDYVNIENIKPYLRPLFSLSVEEFYEWRQLHLIYDKQIKEANEIDPTINYFLQNIERSKWELDWLNSHYVDYNNLIENGLAIAVTKEFNPYTINIQK